MSTDAPVVYVVDDDPSVRAGMRALLRSLGMRVETFASAGEFVRHPRADAPSCLVLDVHLPESSGLDLPAELAASDASLPVVFVTGQGTIPMSVRAIREGALEFLTKPFREEELVAAVREALARDADARWERAELAEMRTRWERLTPREREVLAHVVAGRLNKNIARALGTAEHTIKVHRGRIVRKLEARSVPELVRFVARIAGQPWAAAPPPRRSRAPHAGEDDAPVPPT
jgi:FixJ family two-component response regulator